MEIQEIIQRLKKGKTILIKQKEPYYSGGVVITMFRLKSDPSLYNISGRTGHGEFLWTENVYEGDLEGKIRSLL